MAILVMECLGGVPNKHFIVSTCTFEEYVTFTFEADSVGINTYDVQGCHPGQMPRCIDPHGDSYN
jgi:hypothetical protein